MIGEMIMANLIKSIMSGLIGASALAVIGASASVALTPKNLGAHQIVSVYTTQEISHGQDLHKAVWSTEDQEAFWKEQEDRGGG
jgi:hypothetical protein